MAVGNNSGAAVRHGQRAPQERGKRREPPREKKKSRIFYGRDANAVDMPMLVIILVLLVVGITMMFSASHALSYRDNGGDSYQYARRQLQFALVGLGAMWLFSRIDYRVFMAEWHPKLFGKVRTITMAHFALFSSLVLVAAVIPFGVRNIEDGPKRWLPIPGLGTIQPSDILKFGLIMWLAWYVTKNYQKMRHFTVGLLKPGAVFVLIAVLLMKQPHLSCVIIMAVIFIVMIIIGGANIRQVITCAAIGIPFLVILMYISGYSYYWDRLTTINPLADPSDTTYQSYQAILAVGSGGMWGKGFDNSTQKYYYLPEAQNDFVYAICCEEFGFIGGVMIILLFIIFLLRGFYIGRKSQDRFGLMLATGISLQVGAQALFNIGVNVCALPNTGISLPFFSYGGTALLMLLIEMGVLLSVSRRANLN